MRKRFNRNAVCSSENYSASRKAHLDFLKEKHDHFCGLIVSGEIALDVPSVSDGKFHDKHRQHDKQRTKDIQRQYPSIEVLRYQWNDFSNDRKMRELLHRIGNT